MDDMVTAALLVVGVPLWVIAFALAMIYGVLRRWSEEADHE